MQSLGRSMRRIGETTESSGSGGARKGVLYSSVRPAAAPHPFLRSTRGWMARNLPRRTGLMATVAFLGGTLVYGAILGGHVESVGTGIVRGTGEVAAVAGLGIHSVQIAGARETTEDEIIAALDLQNSPSILTFDPFTARQALLDLPWVREATVQKLYPNMLRVEVTEREAFALWQIGGIVSIVDENGEAIRELTEPRFASLPLVVGFGANRKAGELMQALRPHPQIASRFRAAVRVADRRWNVRLDNGVEIKLPETDPGAAVAELAQLDRDQAILSRDLTSVDLRLTDRIILTLTEDAAVQRKASLKGDGKGKRKGANI